MSTRNSALNSLFCESESCAVISPSAELRNIAAQKFTIKNKDLAQGNQQIQKDLGGQQS